jgi:hypothetical protein
MSSVGFSPETKHELTDDIASAAGQDLVLFWLLIYIVGRFLP